MSDFFDLRKNKFLWVIVIINFVGLLFIAGIILVQTNFILNDINDVSDNVQTKLNHTNELLTKLNKNIHGLDRLNSEITLINDKISLIEKSMVDLSNNSKSLLPIQNDLTKIKEELEILTKLYPPNQTVVLNNISENNLNNIVNNAVDLQFKEVKPMIIINFILNIIFGSLLSLGGISFVVYYTKNKKKK